MKRATILAFGFCGSATMAMPSIGDYARYEISETKNNVVEKFVYEKVIMTMDATAYVMRETQTDVNGKQSIWYTKVFTPDWVTEEIAEKYLTRCTDIGGILEDTPIDGLGNVPTCFKKEKYPANTTATWYGKVAFGLVQFYDKKRHEFYAATLKEHRFGK